MLRIVPDNFVNYKMHNGKNVYRYGPGSILVSENMYKVVHQFSQGASSTVTVKINLFKFHNKVDILNYLSRATSDHLADLQHCISSSKALLNRV